MNQLSRSTDRSPLEGEQKGFWENPDAHGGW
jgi:hypothetical protein